MSAARVSRYPVPRQWLRYDAAAIAGPLIEAKTVAGVLNRLPYTRLHNPGRYLLHLLALWALLRRRGIGLDGLPRRPYDSCRRATS